MEDSSALGFVARLKDLLGQERQVLVEFLISLGDFDRHRRWLDVGYSSLWDFVRRALGQSETMTHYRVSAARLIERFPQAIEPLREGKLCLTTLATLSTVITAENCDSVLAEAMGKPKVEVLRIKARLDPKPIPKDIVARSPGPGLVPAQVDSLELPLATPPPVRKVVLTEEFTRRHLTTDREYDALLEDARAALSHKLPGASEMELLKEGLRSVLREDAKRKGMTDRPRLPKAPAVNAPDAAIPRHVQRVVRRRDKGRCQWPIEGSGAGCVCGSQKRVQFDHIIPRALGGTNDASNIRLLCATHNQHAADLWFGKEHMNQFRRAPHPQRAPGLSAAGVADAVGTQPEPAG